MDVTPTPKMMEAMKLLVDATCGEAPLAVESGNAAIDRKKKRALAFDILHRIVWLAMREGAARAMDPNRAPHHPALQIPAGMKLDS